MQSACPLYPKSGHGNGQQKTPELSPEGFPSRYQPPRPRLYGDVTTLPPNAAAGRLRFIVVVLGIFYRAGYSEVHPNKV